MRGSNGNRRRRHAGSARMRKEARDPPSALPRRDEEKTGLHGGSSKARSRMAETIRYLLDERSPRFDGLTLASRPRWCR